MADATFTGSASFAFGSMSGDRPDRGQLKRGRFRMAVMGDFSGRAARGLVEIGDDLARRRAVRLDVDTLDDIISRFATTLVLPIGKDGAGIEVELRDIDGLHPDELYENVELFEALVSLRRRLGSGATAANAARELKSWGAEFDKPVSAPRRKSGGSAVPADRRLSDFQKLIGGKPREIEASPADDLIARIVGPHVVAVKDSDRAALQEAVDEALSGAMRLVLHHPEFQQVEAQWRMLDLLARSVETDDSLDIILYDISAEEIAADLAGAEDLAETGMYKLLAEGTPDGRGNFSALIGLYTFEETPPHAELLARIARLAAHMDAPFFSAISPAFYDVAREDRHPLVAEAWDSLRGMSEAGHVALASPRFLLRRPYGAKSDPIYEFDFEEFTEHEGLSGMLWANPAVLVAILLARSFRKNGKGMNLGSVMSLGGMPYHFVRDSYGDQVALPCTERNLSEARARVAVDRGYMPVISVKGRDEVRLGSFNALSGSTVLGPWSNVPPPPPTPAAPVRVTAALASAPADEGADEAPAAGDDGGDVDLDALLAGLDDAAEDSSGSDADLDALLASFDDETGSDDAGSTDMDAELAALLADL